MSSVSQELIKPTKSVQFFAFGVLAVLTEDMISGFFVAVILYVSVSAITTISAESLFVSFEANSFEKS